MTDKKRCHCGRLAFYKHSERDIYYCSQHSCEDDTYNEDGWGEIGPHE